MAKRSAEMLIVVAVMAVGLFVSGCSSRGMTASEVNRRHYRSIENNMWQVQEDVDAVLMLDRPIRLSEQSIR